MYRILKNTYNEITMKAKAYNPVGKIVDVHATWAFAPELTFFDDIARVWICRKEWNWIY